MDVLHTPFCGYRSESAGGESFQDDKKGVRAIVVGNIVDLFPNSTTKPTSDIGRMSEIGDKQKKRKSAERT